MRLDKDILVDIRVVVTVETVIGASNHRCQTDIQILKSRPPRSVAEAGRTWRFFGGVIRGVSSSFKPLAS